MNNCSYSTVSVITGVVRSERVLRHIARVAKNMCEPLDCNSFVL